MWEGYHITTRGYIVLVLLLAILTYGLFSLGTLFSQDLKTVVDEGLNGTHTGVTVSEDGDSSTDTVSNDVGVDQPGTTSDDTTQEAVDPVTADPPVKDTVDPPLSEDLVKAATIIYFKPDSYEVDAQAKKDLISFIEIAQANIEIPIIIEGHAGLTSDMADDDEKLALKRAQAIQQYLISMHIASQRIQIMSLIGTTEEMKNQQEVWKAMRAEIYFQGYPQGK